LADHGSAVTEAESYVGDIGKSTKHETQEVTGIGKSAGQEKRRRILSGAERLARCGL